MIKAILYVFYGSPKICATRIRLLREMNPQAKIFGLCTAAESTGSRFRDAASSLDDLWFLPFHQPKWCWHNLDRVVCHWFLQRGQHLEFEKILVLDWDVLLLEPVDKWLSQVDDGCVAFIEANQVHDPEENHWTNSTNAEFAKFKAHVGRKGVKDVKLFTAFLFAYASTKSAFHTFAQEVVGYPGYCEYRLPTLIAQSGLEIVNFKKPSNWYIFASVVGISVARDVILREAQEVNGFKLFHPVYEPYKDLQLALPFLSQFTSGSFMRNASRRLKNLVRRMRGR